MAATKLRVAVEGLAVPAIMATVLVKNSLVAISGDRTVGMAGANATVIGRVSVPNKAAGEKGTVETRCKELIEVTANGALAAGALVKMSSISGSSQRVAAFVAHTDLVAGDPPERLLGVVWFGGADGATIEVLTF